MTSADLSVVLCTFNRAAMLADALGDLSAQVRADPSVEVMVVDNRSTDATRATVARAAASLPSLRYVFEAMPGLSVARNRAVREAAGEWIWFVDDDVRFATGWLDGVRDALRQLPTVRALGGRVIPEFEAPRPAWLGEEMLAHYGATAFGDQVRLLEAGEYAVGCNLGFRRAVFDEVGPFREDLGRCGSSLRSGEESELLERLWRRGHAVGYAPAATIRHRIPPPRATLAWLRRRAFAGGRSVVMVQRHALHGSRARLLRQALVMATRIAAGMVIHGPTADRQVRVALRLGMARQHLVEWVRATHHAAGALAWIP